MGFNSIVCVKQVPDTANITSDAMTPEGTVNRSALPTIFNPEDLHALETALEIRDRWGGKVTVVTMGPPKAADVLRACLFRGADRAILLTDRRAAASDTLATSYILSQAVKTIGDYDFVFCGRQAIDGDTAQTGPQIAEKLSIPQVTYLEQILNVKEGTKKSARIRRNIGNGYEIVNVQLPALVTVVETANEPRPLAAKKVMRNKHAAVPAEVTPEKAEELKNMGLLLEQWTLNDIHADLDRCGLAGSPTKVFRVESIILTKEGFTEVAPTEEAVTDLIQELISERTL